MKGALTVEFLVMAASAASTLKSGDMPNGIDFVCGQPFEIFLNEPLFPQRTTEYQNEL